MKEGINTVGAEPGAEARRIQGIFDTFGSFRPKGSVVVDWPCHPLKAPMTAVIIPITKAMAKNPNAMIIIYPAGKGINHTGLCLGAFVGIIGHRSLLGFVITSVLKIIIEYNSVFFNRAGFYRCFYGI